MPYRSPWEAELRYAWVWEASAALGSWSRLVYE